MATTTETGQTGSGRGVGVLLLAAAVAAAVSLPLVALVLGAADARSSLDLLLADTTLRIALNSALLGVGVTGFSILLGVPLAFLTVRTDLPGKRLFSVALAVPLVVPSYIGAFAFVYVFRPTGPLQELLAPLGVASLPSIYGLGGTVFVLTLYTYPYVFITTRAALKTLDTTLVDAARTLQHTRWEAFRRITLPQIRPAIGAGALLVALYALSDFGTPQIMRFDAYTRVIYSAQQYDFDLAVLLSVQLVVVAFVILAIESRVRGSGVQSEHPGRASSPLRLGRLTWPAVAACLLVPLLALAVPLGVLTLWLLESQARVAPSLAFQPVYAFNSAWLAFAAAAFAALAALPVAWVASRRSRTSSSALVGVLGTVVERVSYVGYALPGVVVGFALVTVAANAGDLYTSGVVYLPLLVFAYVVRFLPQAAGSTRAAFGQVSPALEEAARTLGDSPSRAFRRVTLPLVLPGVLGGAALVFLTTMKELPATLLLRPAEFETLVTHLWTAEKQGYYGQAAIPALVLLLVSALSLLVMVRVEGYDVE
ncbi:ABC transporter permease [Halomarina oriensis]|uniref:ABC transporter permease subunit n=1 Tax=Halomarina oriensis TaxID=671145 RepID=A0A6B0GIC5_9EURY|nr:iron ABC transporter permease [Halomarina oriensis]MWG33627.1 ABC transporter permease subunit [Halomarina oriensis]